MKTIKQYTWKNMLKIQTMELPRDAVILDAHVVHGNMLRISVLLDPNAPEVMRQFRIYTTGDDIPETSPLLHVATVQSHTHVFEVCE